MKRKILKWIAKRIRSEDLVFLICRWMIVHDAPEIRLSYKGNQKIDGLIFKTPYAGDGET